MKKQTADVILVAPASGAATFSSRTFFMKQIVSWAAAFVRIFWTCRVSVLNVFAGLLFFGYLVQAQNLMADLSSIGSLAEYVFWAGVFGFTFLLWAFPVHYGARRSLDAIAPHGTLDGRLGWLILWLPRVLGLLPFLALAWGTHGAIEAVRGAAHVLEAAQLTITQGFWLQIANVVVAILFAAGVIFRKCLIPDDWDGTILHPLALVLTALIFLFAYVAPIPASVHFPALSSCRHCSAASCWVRVG